MSTQHDNPDPSSVGDFTQTTAPHGDWIAAARAEAAVCDLPHAETSSSAAFGGPDSPVNLRNLLGERYELGAEIRRGGQGVVYRGVQRGTRRDVAIKVMSGNSRDPSGRARFEREAQILAQLRHPNIVTIHESGGAASALYYVMDFIPGQPLDEYMRARAPTSREIAALFLKICEAVNVAHLRGVIHRDLKPSNIRVDPAGEPHVLDFGLAKISSQFSDSAFASGDSSSDWTLLSGQRTDTGEFLGSVPWASPEQVAARPDEMDVRTDVYSLGVMLYQFLTGYMPYPMNGPARAVLENICSFEPKNPAEIAKGVGDDLAQIVLKCLRKRREDRYQTAGDLARELRRYLAGEPIEAKRDHTWYMLRKRLRQYRTLALASAVLVLLVTCSLVALAAYYRTEHGLRTAAEAAQREAEDARKEAREIAAFQAKVLMSIDAEAMGREIQTQLRSAVENSLRRPQESSAAVQSDAEIARELALYDKLTANVAPVDIVRQALARNVLGKVPEMVEANFPTQPRVQAELLLTVGGTLRNLGQMREAEAPLLRALELIRTQPEGSKQRLVDEADALSHLAGTYSQQGRFQEAEALHAQTYELLKRSGPVGATTAIRALCNVAAMRAKQGDSDNAIVMFRSAVEQARAAEAPDPLLLPDTLGNLGPALGERGDYKEAEPILLEAIQLRTAAQGPEHEAVANTKMNLASVYFYMGRHDKSEALVREALETFRKRLGDEHPDTADGMSSLAALIRDEDPAAALRLYESALAIYRGTLGENHPQTAKGMDNVGSILRQSGDYDAAEPLIREALARRRVLLNGDHPDVVQSINNLARLLLSRGNAGEAADFYREGLEMAQRIGMPARRERVLVMNLGLGRSLTALGALIEARKQLDIVARELDNGATFSNRAQRSFFEGQAEFYRALDKAEPNAGHAAAAEEWNRKLSNWEATTQPANP